METFLVNVESLNDYELSGETYSIKRGALISGTIKKNGRDVRIKKVEKTPDNIACLDYERNVFRKFNHPCVAKLLSIFEDQQCFYYVYKGFEGFNMKVYLDENRRVDYELSRALSSQFLSVLEALHKLDFLYLRDSIENVFFNEETQKLMIYGIDSGCPQAQSMFLKADNPISSVTDYFVLAQFIHLSLEGKEIDEEDLSSLPKDAKKLIKALIANDQSKRKLFIPRSNDFLRPKIRIVEENESLHINDFQINWEEEGLCFGFGETLVGWREGIFLQSGDFSLTIDLDGLHIEGEEGFTASLGLDGLKFTGPKDSLMTIDEYGFNYYYRRHWHKQKHFSIDDNGATYESYQGRLAILDSGLDNTFPLDKFKSDFSDGKFKIKVGGKMELILSTSSIKLKVGTAGIKICEKGLILYFKPIKIKFLFSGHVQFLSGSLNMDLSSEGFQMIAGGLALSINDVIEAECEGFKLRYDDDGLMIDNENNPFDFSSYLTKIPKIKIKLPSLSSPKVPKIPKIPFPKIDLGISDAVPDLVPDIVPDLPVPIPGVSFSDIASIDLYKLFTLKDKDGAEGEAQNYLEPNENVILIANVLKTRFLSRKKRSLVLTSNGRLFYCTPKFEYKMGDIVLCKDSVVTTSGSDELSVTNDKGRKYNLKFPDGNRAQWVAAIQKEIDRLKA